MGCRGIAACGAHSMLPVSQARVEASDDHVYRKVGKRKKLVKFRNHPYQRAPPGMERVALTILMVGVRSYSFFRFGLDSIVCVVNRGRIWGGCDENEKY